MYTVGVQRNLVVKFVAIRLRGPRFKPQLGRNFKQDFCFRRTPCSASWDHNIGYQSQSQAFKLTLSIHRMVWFTCTLNETLDSIAKLSLMSLAVKILI